MVTRVQVLGGKRNKKEGTFGNSNSDKPARAGRCPAAAQRGKAHCLVDALLQDAIRAAIIGCAILPGPHVPSPKPALPPEPTAAEPPGGSLVPRRGV